MNNTNNLIFKILLKKHVQAKYTPRSIMQQRTNNIIITTRTLRSILHINTVYYRNQNNIIAEVQSRTEQEMCAGAGHDSCREVAGAAT